MGNLSLGFVIIFILGLWIDGDNLLIVIPIFILSVIVARYINLLEVKAGIDKKIRKLGLISFFVSGLIGFLIIFFNIII
ncbi:hypothetical protein J2Z83_003914 [Virgibacillus natechei]|uniref:DUF4181 domain-containing protein n=1 Tax=Virgibacillus natechei TaxID=1216297 RepID=A0ABS4ILF8_9BACI|nr:hypothetical protein [Virgibacillus natechei]